MPLLDRSLMICIKPLENAQHLPIGVEAYGHADWYCDFLSSNSNSMESAAAGVAASVDAAASAEINPLCLAVSVLLDNLALSLQNLLGLQCLLQRQRGYFICVLTAMSPKQQSLESIESIGTLHLQHGPQQTSQEGPARLLLQSAVLGLVNLGKQVPDQVVVLDSEIISQDELTQHALQLRMKRVLIGI